MLVEICDEVVGVQGVMGTRKCVVVVETEDVIATTSTIGSRCCKRKAVVPQSANESKHKRCIYALATKSDADRYEQILWGFDGRKGRCEESTAEDLPTVKTGRRRPGKG